MKTEFFIANRITFSRKDGRSFTGPIVNISVAGIALGLAVMILSMAIVTGFRDEVSNKVTGFSADVQISNFDANNSFETQPVSIQDVPLNKIAALDGVTHYQPYIVKSGIIKTTDDIQAVVLKGVVKRFLEIILHHAAHSPHTGHSSRSVGMFFFRSISYQRFR